MVKHKRAILPWQTSYKGYRELHVGGDYLLVYKVNESKQLITFTDFGTHAELFD